MPRVTQLGSGGAEITEVCSGPILNAGCWPRSGPGPALKPGAFVTRIQAQPNSHLCFRPCDCPISLTPPPPPSLPFFLPSLLIIKVAYFHGGDNHVEVTSAPKGGHSPQLPPPVPSPPHSVWMPGRVVPLPPSAFLARFGLSLAAAWPACPPWQAFWRRIRPRERTFLRVPHTPHHSGINAGSVKLESAAGRGCRTSSGLYSQMCQPVRPGEAARPRAPRLPLHPAHTHTDMHTPTLEVPYSEPFSSALARTTGQQPHNSAAILGSSSVFLLRMQSFIHLLMHAFIPVCAFIHTCIIHVCAAFMHVRIHSCVHALFTCVCLHSHVHAFIHVCTPSSVHTCILCTFIHSRAHAFLPPPSS